MSVRLRAALVLSVGVPVLCVWHFILRAQGRGIPLITDEGEYAVAARAWAEGGLPYRDAFSQKPPLVFAAYRAAYALWDVPDAPRALTVAAGLAAMVCLFFCAPAEWRPGARLAGPAAFASLAALPVGDYGFTANTEVFVNLFASLSALALLRGAPFLAGLAAGVALSAKQTALWTVLGFGAAAAWTPRGLSRPRAGRYALGTALVPAAWAVYFAARGGLADYWDAAWGGNARYAAILLMSGALGGQLSWFASVLLPRLLAFCLPALLLAGYGLRGRRAGPERPVETVAVVWLGTAIAGALTGLFFFPHYFLPTAPALSLAAACGVERLRTKPRRALAAALLALWPALLAPRLLFLEDARQRGLAFLYPNPLFEVKSMAEELARRAAPGDRLHVFGSEGALFPYSGLRPATRHTLCYALTLFPKDAAGWRREMQELAAAPPRFVVWSGQPLSTMISSSLGADYRNAMIAFLARRYLYSGSVRVIDTPLPPVFAAAGPQELPPFSAEDRLLLFERKP